MSSEIGIPFKIVEYLSIILPRHSRSRFWKWSEGREEYDIVHQEEGWEVLRSSQITDSSVVDRFLQARCTSTGEVEATLAVPYRPQLFGKTTPVVLNLSRVALAKDEVFLLLTFIYCEMKRQEKTVCHCLECLAFCLINNQILQNSSGGW